MILYLLIIFSCSLIIAASVSLWSGQNFLLLFGLVAIGVVFEILVDGLIATIARLMPAKCADHTKKVFVVSAKEKKFYEKLKIRLWKDKIPEIGHFTGFRKNKLVDPQSIEYVDRFLLESCYGEIGHFFSLFFGFAVLLLYPLSNVWVALAIPVAIVNFFLNLPSILVLRYNSYKLVVLKKSLLKKQQRKKAVDTVTEIALANAEKTE
jgi:glycosyl-4,4'-diaponeurosporenoate acyltransferase